MDVRSVDLRALNSLTKYPEIPTYHQLDPRSGCLLDEAVPFQGQVIGTEKIDGTNSRIILLPGGGYLIGSREELLYASGDLIGNPTLGIVDNLKPVVEAVPRDLYGDVLRVLYLELYGGGKIGAGAKQYSTRGAVGWRLFDAVDVYDYAEKLSWEPARISSWRQHGGQAFAVEEELASTASAVGVQLTPRLFTIDASEVPTDVEKMYAFLGEHLPRTLVALDDSGKGRPEGIVLRTSDRSAIAKARFQDYERTIRRGATK